MVYAYPDVIERICSNGGEEEDACSEAPQYSAIQQFYEDANVFITGGTGFIGMVLVEKLLRSCPGIKHVLLLVRSHKGKTAEERIKEMFRNPLYLRLLKSEPKILDKVKIVHGDAEHENLGMSASDTELLKKEVNVLINVAATVRFDEHLKKAYTINVVSLKTIVALAESMTNLKALVHVSTAFTHIHRKSTFTEEKFYPCPYTESVLESFLNSADDYTIAVLTNPILGKLANTYVFTKGMGEELLRRKINSLPIAIYRPSVVMNTYMEPIHGWSSTLQGAGALITGVGLGVLRVLNIPPDKRSDIIPVDKCASALIALPWHIHTSRPKKSEMTPIFNHVTDKNPIGWESLTQIGIRVFHEDKLSSKHQVWAPNFCYESGDFLYNVKFFIYHVIPLPLFMLAEKLKKQPPRIRKVYTKIALLASQANPFTKRNWTFSDSNTSNLWTSMSDLDRRLFPLDVADLDWERYFKWGCKGTLLYVMRESAGSKVTRQVQIMSFLDTMLQQFVKAIKLLFVYKTSILTYNLVKTFIENEIKMFEYL